jgi:glycine/serine hydroxymethyltransferase
VVRGLKETDMETIEFIDKLILNHKDRNIISDVKKSVNQWISDKPLFI